MSDFHWISEHPLTEDRLAEQKNGAARDFELMGSVRRVTGAVWLPDKFDKQTPLVLLGHGASGDRFQAPIPHLAGRLTRESGFAALAIDGPVHGLRRVEPGGREAFFKEAQRPEFVDDMVADWSDAYRALRTECEVGFGPLGYFGLSMGTIFGVPLLASKLTFQAAVIGLCGTTGAGAGLADRLRSDAAQITHPVSLLMQLEGATDKRLHANPGLHPEVPAEEIAHAFDFLSAHLSGEVPRRIVNPLAE